jgi:hypothetical protein
MVTSTPAASSVNSVANDESIRPFEFHASDDALADLRRRIAATNWPEQELVADPSQGVQLATMHKLVLLENRTQLAERSSKAERLTPIHHNYRRARSSFHPCPLEASRHLARHHHARLAWLDHRAVEDHRPTDESEDGLYEEDWSEPAPDGLAGGCSTDCQRRILQIRSQD